MEVAPAFPGLARYGDDPVIGVRATDGEEVFEVEPEQYALWLSRNLNVASQYICDGGGLARETLEVITTTNRVRASSKFFGIEVSGVCAARSLSVLRKKVCYNITILNLCGSEMAQIQALTDKAAVGFSLMCAAHCLLLPVALSVLPSVATLTLLSDEFFHRALLGLVLPTSVIALTLGCRKHKRYGVWIAGAVGLTALVAAAALGQDLLGDFGEKGLTFAGAVIIALSHVQNFRLCRRDDACHSTGAS